MAWGWPPTLCPVQTAPFGWADTHGWHVDTFPLFLVLLPVSHALNGSVAMLQHAKATLLG